MVTTHSGSITAAGSPAATEAALVPTAPPPKLLVPLIVAGAFGLYFASLTPTIVTLAVRMFGIDAEGKALGLSTVLLIGSVVSIAATPLFGALSDHTTGRFGRRRPWMVGGALVALVALIGLVVIGLADSVMTATAGWAVTQLGYAAALAGFLALIPELVPEHLRARLSGFIGLVTSLAVLTGVTFATKLAAHPVAMMAVPGLVAVVTLLMLAVVIRKADQGADRAGLAPYSVREFFSSFWINPLAHRDYAWNWASRFLFGCAMAGMMTYTLYFLTDAVGLELGEATARQATITEISTPVAIACFVFAGILSDKLGRRKVFVATAAALTGTALIVAAVTQSYLGFLIVYLIYTVGQACYLTVDLAIAAAVVPDPQEAAKAMSVYQVATSAPNSVVPIIGAVLLTTTGNDYGLFFGLLAVVAALSAVAVLFVRRVR